MTSRSFVIEFGITMTSQRAPLCIVSTTHRPRQGIYFAGTFQDLARASSLGPASGQLWRTARERQSKTVNSINLFTLFLWTSAYTIEDMYDRLRVHVKVSGL